MAVTDKRTLGDALDDVAARYPDNEAIVFQDQRITYRELRRRSDLLAKGLLKLGIKRGEHVALWMGNRPEWICTEYAVAKLGAVLVTVNTRFRAAEARYVLGQSDASAIVLADRFLNIGFLDMLTQIAPELPASRPGNLRAAALPELRSVVSFGSQKSPGTFAFDDVIALGETVTDAALAEAQAACHPDDVLLMIYTSGTTGHPKGAMLTHRSTLDHMAVVTQALDLTAGHRIFCGQPMLHVAGSVLALMTALLTASTMCLLETFDPEESLRMIDRERCEVINGVPTMFIMMLEHPNFGRYNTRSARTGLIGGAPAPVALIRDIIEKMGVRHLVSSYGLTEACSCQTGTKLDDPPELIASTIGVAFPDNEIGVFDPQTRQPLGAGQQGELCLRGSDIMQGYYKKPAETAQAIDQDGWLHTGDLVVRDENGYLRITGRVKDMFIVGGQNAYPAEIENVIFTHPKVRQVQVVGVPDHRLGEVGMAFIELKEPHSATEEEIINFCQTQLANYKVPRYAKFVAEFPMTTSGKIQKFKLRDEAIVDLGLTPEM